VTRREKLIQRILARPPQARFADVRALLEEFGWALDRTRGSHHFFVKPGERTLSVPVSKGRWVKRVYLKEITERLDLEN
jgi:predicted RNA binding protein YcfA (HicA-like mRNA interferase family)